MRAACPLPYIQCCPPSGSVLSRPWVVLSHTKDFFVKILGYLRNPGSSTPWGRALSCSSPSGVMCCRTSRILGCSIPVCLWSAVAPFGVRALSRIKDYFSECLGRCRPSAPGPVSGIKDFFVYFGSIVWLSHECYRCSVRASVVKK